MVDVTKADGSPLGLVDMFSFTSGPSLKEPKFSEDDVVAIMEAVEGLKDEIAKLKARVFSLEGGPSR